MYYISFPHWATVLGVVAVVCVCIFLIVRPKPSAVVSGAASANLSLRRQTYLRFKIAFTLIWVGLATIFAVSGIEKRTGIQIPPLLALPVVLVLPVSIVAYYLYLSRLAGYMGKSRIIIPGLAFLFASLGGPIWAFLYMVGQAKAQGWVPGTAAPQDAARVG
jgi:hypothetical protein